MTRAKSRAPQPLGTSSEDHLAPSSDPYKKETLICHLKTNWGPDFIINYVSKLNRHKQPGSNISDDHGVYWPYDVLQALYQLSCIHGTREHPQNIQAELAAAVDRRRTDNSEDAYLLLEEDVRSMLEVATTNMTRDIQRFEPYQLEQLDSPNTLVSSTTTTDDTGAMETHGLPIPLPYYGQVLPIRNEIEPYVDPALSSMSEGEHEHRVGHPMDSQGNSTFPSQVQPPIQESLQPTQQTDHPLANTFGYFHGPYGHNNETIRLSSQGSIICGAVTDQESMTQCGLVKWAKVGQLRKHLANDHHLEVDFTYSRNTPDEHVAAFDALQLYYTYNGIFDQTTFASPEYEPKRQAVKHAWLKIKRRLLESRTQPSAPSFHGIMPPSSAPFSGISSSRPMVAQMVPPTMSPIAHPKLLSNHGKQGNDTSEMPAAKSEFGLKRPSPTDIMEDADIRHKRKKERALRKRIMEKELDVLKLMKEMMDDEVEDTQCEVFSNDDSLGGSINAPIKVDDE